MGESWYRTPDSADAPPAEGECGGKLEAHGAHTHRQGGHPGGGGGPTCVGLMRISLYEKKCAYSSNFLLLWRGRIMTETFSSFNSTNCCKTAANGTSRGGTVCKRRRKGRREGLAHMHTPNYRKGRTGKFQGSRPSAAKKDTQSPKETDKPTTKAVSVFTTNSMMANDNSESRACTRLLTDLGISLFPRFPFWVVL